MGYELTKSDEEISRSWLTGSQLLKWGGLSSALVGIIAWSNVNAYNSAKRIDSEASNKISSTSLNYIPHRGLMASYNFRF